MHRLLVTRPRSGSRCPLRGLRRRRRERVPHEEAPRYESMRGRPRTKYASEYFAPLIGFLRKSVGRPWDDVYSEIRRTVRPDGVVQQHVYVHLRELVADPVFERDGRLYANSWCGQVMELGAYSGPNSFYVCPRTHRLRLLPWRAASGRRRREDFSNADIRVVATDRQLHRLDGVWYEIGLAPVPTSAEEQRRAFDRVLRMRLAEITPELRALALAGRYGNGSCYGATRRTISRRELRRLPELPCADWRPDAALGVSGRYISMERSQP